MKRGKLFPVNIFCFCALLLGLPFSLSAQEQFEFSSLPYKKSAPAELYFLSYIEKAAWDNEGLIVYGTVSANCAHQSFRGKYRINNKNLKLFVLTPPKLTAAASCNCHFPVIFKLKGLKKDDYNVAFFAFNKDPDSFKLLSDGRIVDACSESPTYDCYVKHLDGNRIEKNESTTEKEVITFGKDEYKKIAQKYPQFLTLFKKHTTLYTPRCRRYHFDLIRKWLNYRGNAIECRACAVSGTFGEPGADFEQVVKKTIARWQQDYGPDSLAAELSKKLGVEVTYINDNRSRMRFSLNGEVFFYNSRNGSIELKNQLCLVFKYKDRALSIEKITKEDLYARVETAKKFHDILGGDTRIDFKTLSCIYADYDEIKGIASFEGNIKPDKEK
ncbi:MAG: hypothetical protein PHV55_09670, partial [Candidatus Omnitrophica bacterium]|nr:hypothetical protein [Candidatus Omnitrophota bacterium]